LVILFRTKPNYSYIHPLCNLRGSSEYQVCTLAFISLLAILVLPKIWYVYLHHTSHSLYIYIYVCHNV
jgi:hypothetical protein